MSKETLSSNVFTGGLNFSIPGEGGAECVNFLDTSQRVFETILFFSMSVALAIISVKGLKFTSLTNNNESPVKSENQFLLLIFAMVFGIELGFKLANRQMIWLLNPCHMITMLQLYLLSSKNKLINIVLFKLHLYWLTGPLLAILFPVTVTRHLPGEVLIYWVQHFLLVSTPVFLITRDRESSSWNAAFTRDQDLRWAGLALSLLSLYHWLVLQPIGLLTEVNLNNMICPALSDPFHGQYYRVIAMGYFSFLLPLVGGLYSLIGHSINENSKQD